MKNITVKQDEETPVAIEVMAASIVAISDGVKRLMNGPLNEDALIMLIQNASPNVSAKRKYGRTKVKISSKQVQAVIQGINNLAATYLKPVKK